MDHTSIRCHIDPEYELRQLEIFKAMVEKGLIYRQHRPVHYSPSSRSALAEAELVYNEAHVSHSVYVSFQLDPASEHMSDALRALITDKENVSVLVWTTTPWTLTANMVGPITVIPAVCMLMASLYRLLP